MKKILFLVAVSFVTLAQAYKQFDLKLALNPKRMCLKGLDLRAAPLKNKNLEGKAFISCDFRGADLKDTNCTDDKFVDCMLVDTCTEGTIVNNALFLGCEMSNIRGIQTYVEAPIIQEAIPNIYFYKNDMVEISLKVRGSWQVFKVRVSGLCRKIYNEAVAAQAGDDD